MIDWKSLLRRGKQESAPARQPAPQVQREERRPFNSDFGYEGGSSENSMLSGWRTDSSITPSAELHYNLDTIRTRARWAVQNDPIAASFLNKIVRNIVGDKGFMPVGVDPRHAAAISAHSRPENFCTDGRTSRCEFERLIVKHIVRDGEVLIAKHNAFGGGDSSRFAVSVIDPGYLHTDRFNGDFEFNGNRVRLGVEVDKHGKAVAYHFRGQSRSYQSAWSYWSGDIIRIPAENILHLYTTDYADLNRGVSWLTPALSLLEQLRRYRYHALDAARIGAKVSVSSQSATGDPLDGAAGGYEPQPGNADESADKSRPQKEHFMQDMTGASIWNVSSDHMLKMNQAVYPHQMYDPFVDSMLKAISSALDYPEPLLTNNWQGINYSAGQLLMADAEMKCRRLREWMKEFEMWWHTPWIKQAVMHGAVMLPPSKVMSAIEMIDWNGAVVPPADMAKAAAANRVLMESGVKSRQQVCEELGLNWEEQKAKIMAEEKEFGAVRPAAPAANDKDDDTEESDDDKTADSKGEKKS